MGDLIVPVCPAVMGLLFRNGLREGSEMSRDGVTRKTLRSRDGKTVLGVLADRAASNPAFQHPRGRLTPAAQKLAMVCLAGLYMTNGGHFPRGNKAPVKNVTEFCAADYAFLRHRKADELSSWLKSLAALPRVLACHGKKHKGDRKHPGDFVKMITGVSLVKGRTFQDRILGGLCGGSDAWQVEGASYAE